MAYANSTQHPKQFGLEEPAEANRDGKFFVTTTADIQTPRANKVPRGAHVLIDPSIEPKDLDTVLVGNHLEPWAKQPEILGVATQWNQHFR